MKRCFQFPDGSGGHLTDDWMDRVRPGHLMPFFGGCGIAEPCVAKRAEQKLKQYALQRIEDRLSEAKRQVILLQHAAEKLSTGSIYDFEVPASGKEGK